MALLEGSATFGRLIGLYASTGYSSNIGSVQYDRQAESS